MVRRIRQLEQRNEQLSGQVARLLAAVNAAVTDVAVTGGTLTVTHGDGDVESYTLPAG